MTYSVARLLVIAATLALSAPPGEARAAQRAHGRPHSRYAAELAERVAKPPAGDHPLTLDEASAGDANHRRAVRLRFRNTSDQAIAGFAWQWMWGGEGCPALTDVAGAPGAYGAAGQPAVGPGQVVDVYVSPEVVRDLLRTTHKRCDHKARLTVEVTSVRFENGSQWTAPK